MPNIRIIVLILPLYNNIVKISLRNDIFNILCVVSREYYGVKESPLHEHGDVCPAMRTSICFLLASL